MTTKYRTSEAAQAAARRMYARGFAVTVWRDGSSWIVWHGVPTARDEREARPC